jgi:hemerythrin-like domain-containing protein
MMFAINGKETNTEYFCSMEEVKPIKRSNELAPLSREHHEGLLFVWKLRQGLGKNVSAERLKKYIFWQWQNHIKPHFYQEEKILLAFISPQQQLAGRMLKEHENIRELILSLDKEADRNTIAMLADQVNDHIRFEERRLFNYLEESLSSDQLKLVLEQIEEHPVTCDIEWGDKFW